MVMEISKVKISGKEKMQLFGNLSTMLKAGVPIMGAVKSLLEESKGSTEKVLTAVRENLKAGRVLHESLQRFPKSFDTVTISLIKASEEAGTLETTLRDVRDNIQREIEFADKIKSALMYPAFVIVVFFGVMLAMLIFVMPRISQVFRRLKMDLPLPTKIMMYASEALLNHSLLVIGGLTVLVILIVIFYRVNRKLVLNTFFSFPFLSGMMREIDLTKFTRSLSLLLASGLPILTALELAEDVVIKKDLKNLLSAARKKVETGEKLATGLRSGQGLVSGVVVKLIEVGESTGSLDQSMKDVTDMMDYRVSRKLEKATALLEPIMLVVVAMAVGSMMIAIIGPIYGLISDVTPN